VALLLASGLGSRGERSFTHCKSLFNLSCPPLLSFLGEGSVWRSAGGLRLSIAEAGCFSVFFLPSFGWAISAEYCVFCRSNFEFWIDYFLCNACVVRLIHGGGIAVLRFYFRIWVNCGVDALKLLELNGISVSQF